jgi:murein DD-endopeptidase MepM/ murein hydrolase activator NlpD
MYKILFVGMALFIMIGLQSKLIAQDARFRVPLGAWSIVCSFDATNCASSNHHTGVDYHTTNGNYDILATNAGKIVKIQPNDGTNDHGLGNAVIIEHLVTNPNGGVETLYSLYGHLSGFVSGLYVGEAVVKGQKIGTMGSSGYGSATYWGSTPHLHFEIKYSPVLNNPSGGGQYQLRIHRSDLVRKLDFNG